MDGFEFAAVDVDEEDDDDGDDAHLTYVSKIPLVEDAWDPAYPKASEIDHARVTEVIHLRCHVTAIV